MVELRLLSAGSKPDSSHLIQRFPCAVGRSPEANLRLEQPGVWDKHFRIELDQDGFVVVALPEAHTSVNGELVQRAHVRNGDLIEAGGAKLQFWLAQPSRRRLTFREITTWFALGLLGLLEVAIVYALVR